MCSLLYGVVNADVTDLLLLDHKVERDSRKLRDAVVSALGQASYTHVMRTHRMCVKDHLGFAMPRV